MTNPTTQFRSSQRYKLLCFIGLLCIAMLLSSCALRGRGERSNTRSQFRAQAGKVDAKDIQNASDPVTQKGIQLMDDVSGQITVIRGMLYELEQLEQNIASVPAGLTSKNFRIEAVRSALRECWGEPARESGEAEPIPIDYSGVSNPDARGLEASELSQTQLAITNAYDAVSPCAPPSADDAKKFPPRTPQSAFTFVEGKIVEVDAIRILVDQMPTLQEEAILKLSASSQQIALLAMDVENDSKRSQKERKVVTAQLNNLLEGRVTGLELELNALATEIEEKLDQAQNSVEDMLASYPFMGLP